jgi:hypothetical protein
VGWGGGARPGVRVIEKSTMKTPKAHRPKATTVGVRPAESPALRSSTAPAVEATGHCGTSGVLYSFAMGPVIYVFHQDSVSATD